jgi:hypothetical protein
MERIHWVKPTAVAVNSLTSGALWRQKMLAAGKMTMTSQHRGTTFPTSLSGAPHRQSGPSRKRSDRMRPVNAVCVGDPAIVRSLRSWGVTGITIGETIPDRAPVDWDAFHRTVDAVGPEGLGIVVRTLDDVARVNALPFRPAHLGILFFTWRLPPMRQAIIQTGLPIRVFGYFLELEHYPHWILERVAYEHFPNNTQIVVAVLSEYRRPFRYMRHNSQLIAAPEVFEIRELLDTPGMSLCAEWQSERYRTWFVGSMRPGVPITLVVGEVDTADFLPPGMTLEQTEEFLCLLSRMDRRRSRFAALRACDRE